MTFCTHCGQSIGDQDAFCGHCGAPHPRPHFYPYPQQVLGSGYAFPHREHNTKAIISLVLGIISTVFCLIPILALILGIAGLIFSILGLKSEKRIMAGFGMGLSIFGMAVNLLFIILVLIGMANSVFNHNPTF